MTYGSKRSQPHGVQLHETGAADERRGFSIRARPDRDAIQHVARWPWVFVAVFAVVNACTVPPLLSGNTGLLFAILLAVGAAAGLPALTKKLPARKTVLTVGWIVLVLFLGSQIGARFDFGRRRTLAGIDFSAYYLAGKALREPGKKLYYIPVYPDGRMKLVPPIDRGSYWYRMATRSGIPETMQFNYPPFAAIPFVAFAALPYQLAYTVWTAINVLLLVVSAYFLSRLASSGSWKLLFVSLMIAAFSFSPVRGTIFFGQVGIVVLFLWTIGVYLLKGQRTTGSALCFALGTLFKLTPVLVVPLFVLKRKWRWLGAYAAWMMVLLAVMLWATGWENLRIFISRALPTMSCGIPALENRSVVALVQQLYLGFVPANHELPTVLPHALCTAGKAVALALYGAMLYILARRRSDIDLVYSTVVIALVSLLVSPINWWHQYALAILPLVFLWSYAPLLERSPKLRFTTALATLLIGTNATVYLIVLLRQPILELTIAALQPLAIVALMVLHARQSDCAASSLPCGAKNTAEGSLSTLDYHNADPE